MSTYFMPAIEDTQEQPFWTKSSSEYQALML